MMRARDVPADETRGTTTPKIALARWRTGLSEFCAEFRSFRELVTGVSFGNASRLAKNLSVTLMSQP
jgi:hypothetical protein